MSSHEDEIRFIENMAIRGATTGIQLGTPCIKHYARTDNRLTAQENEVKIISKVGFRP